MAEQLDKWIPLGRAAETATISLAQALREEVKQLELAIDRMSRRLESLKHLEQRFRTFETEVKVQSRSAD